MDFTVSDSARPKRDGHVLSEPWITCTPKFDWACINFEMRRTLLISNKDNAVSDLNLQKLRISREDRQIKKEFYVTDKSREYFESQQQLFEIIVVPETSEDTVPQINYARFRGNTYYYYYFVTLKLNPFLNIELVRPVIVNKLHEYYKWMKLYDISHYDKWNKWLKKYILDILKGGIDDMKDLWLIRINPPDNENPIKTFVNNLLTAEVYPLLKDITLCHMFGDREKSIWIFNQLLASSKQKIKCL